MATAAAGPLFLLLLLVLFLLLFLLQSIQQQWEFLVAIAVDDALMRFAIRDRRMHIWLEKYHRIGESFEAEDNRTWFVVQERDRFARFDTDDKLNKFVENRLEHN